MNAYLVIVTGLCCFFLGVVTVALFAWFTVPEGSDPEFDRRRDEQRLQRLTHAAMAQMLAEARQSHFGQRPSGE